MVFKHLHALGSIENVCVDVRCPLALGSAGADLRHMPSLRFFTLTSALVCFVSTYHKGPQMKASHCRMGSSRHSPDDLAVDTYTQPMSERSCGM